MATPNVGRLQCLYSHVSNYRQYHGLQQGTFVYLRFTGIIYNRNDGFQKNFSTSPRNAARSADLTRYQKFRKVISTFVAGSKHLGKDVKVMFQIQRKLKSNNYNWEVLKTEEILHLHQVRMVNLKELFFCKISPLKSIGTCLWWGYSKLMHFTDKKRSSEEFACGCGILHSILGLCSSICSVSVSTIKSWYRLQCTKLLFLNLAIVIGLGKIIALYYFKAKLLSQIQSVTFAIVFFSQELYV